MLVEETISARELAGHPPARRKSGASGQGESEVGRWLVASVGVGAVGVLVGFWGFVAWLLYALFA
jgi:hypothetical protein